MADNAFDAMNDDTGNAFDALESGRGGQLRVTARKVSGVNPDQRAESLRLSADMGLPFDVVERNLSEVKKKREDNAFDALADDPALASWIVSDQNNAALAKDDVPTLTGLSRAMQSASDAAGQVPSEFNRFFGRGVSGLGDLNDAGANMLGRGIERIPFVGGPIADFLRTPIPAWANPSAWARGAGGFIEREFTTQLPEERRNLATDVAGGIGQLIGQGVVTAANPTAAVALNLGVGADQAADMAREEGAEGTFGADAAVLASAPVAAALEKLGLSKLLERAPPGVRNAVTRYVVDKVVAAGIEGTQEAAEQVAYNAIAELAYNPDQSLTEGMGDNFTVGAAVGAVARVLVGARFARSRTEREAETLDAMEAAAGASLLRTRDPARFAAMVRQLAASGADTVFVDAEQAQTYFQSAALDPASLGIDAEALSEAVALGGDLAIPMETWLTTIAPDHGAALREFRRIGQASLAPGEVAGEEVELDEAAERFLASVEEGGTTDSRVFDDVLGQLLGTDMDRATAEKNATLMQSVFRSLAARSGRDAWSLYEQYGLRIVRERPEATAVLRRVPNIDATIDSMLDRLAAGDIPTEADVFGPTISEFLSVAGIRPAENEPLSGEIARLAEDDRFTRKGKKRLVRPDDPAALTLDYAREAAVEAGFLPEGADINDLLDALGADRRMDVPQDQALADLRNALLELDEEVARLGLDPVQDRDEVKRRLFPAGEMDQPAYHGTPHTVDRFSLQKIGTGEGAQAYGWGLYFASAREVAEWYRDNLTAKQQRPANIAAAGGNPFAGAPILERAPDATGNLYQVDIPDDGDLMDWDKPMSTQPEKIRSAARRVWDTLPEWFKDESFDRLNVDFDELAGREFYQLIGKFADEGGMPGEFEHPQSTERQVDGHEAASHALFVAGIPGLRYLDGNSRSDWQLSPPSQTAAGDWMVKDRSKPDSKGLHFDNEADARAELERRQKKTHNYVIWDEAAISEPTTLFQSGVASNAREVSSFDYVPKVGEGKIDTTISDAHVTSGGWVRGFGPAGTLKMVIEARLGRNKAGRVQLDYDPDEGRVTASGLEVSAEARRKGVASAMFDAAFMANPLSDIGHHGTTGDGTEFATAYGEGRVNGKRVFLRPDRLRRGSGVARGAAGGELIATHNLSAENLMHALRVGGLAVPSLAITKGDAASTNFGDITLVGPQDLIDPAKGAKAFAADIYSPRYPQVSYKLDDATIKRVLAVLKPFVQEGDGRWSIDTGDPVDDLTRAKPFQRYVADKLGDDPDRVRYHALKAEAETLLREAGAPERLFLGFTNSGNRRYKPHTLENVVAILKKELRGGEGFNYGVGSLRAKFTPQFRTISQIRKNKGRLVSAEDFAKIKEEIDAEFFEIVESLRPYSPQARDYGFADTVIGVIEDAARMGIPRALREYGIEDVGEDTQRSIAEFMTKLRELPTEYFEVKQLRSVGVNEFRAAAVPSGTKPEVVDALRRAGLRVVEYEGGNDAARRAAIKQVAEQETLLFQSAVDQTATPEFKRWFGDSKVVDENGAPLVVYHGTKADFDSFDIGRETKNFGTFGEFATSRAGAFFTPDKGFAKTFAGKSGKLLPTYLSIQNPLDLSEGYPNDFYTKHGDLLSENNLLSMPADGMWELFDQGFPGSEEFIAAVKADGYDGVRMMERDDDGSARDVFVAFRPEQIKSATANRGTFDPNDPSILNQDGDPTTEAIRRGYIKFTSDRKFTIGLTENADLSTFLHESAHFFLEVLGDLASDSANAPQGLVDDYMAILRWLGAPRREEIGVEQHEQFARGFEAYLGEGKPPTPELAGAFARFRAWMKAIYKTLTALDVNLTDEVRGVFDRIVAGDEAIRRAEEAVNVEPLFNEAARAGMSEARFREYLRLQQAGHDEAEARLTAQAMKEVKRETEAWWREESARVREEVAAEVYATPVYRAWAALARNQQPDGTALDTPPVKLDKGWLLDKYGQEFLNKNLLRKNVYAVEGGISGDIAAGLFGFRTGDELVTALANAAPMKAWIKADTDSRMRERHGDMRLDGSLPEKAMAAVHNSKRMKAIAADIALLEGLAGEPAMNPAALRQWAEARIARTPIRKLTPYAFLRSERKHAREAVKAAAAGKWSEALVAQRRRLAHAHLYDVAVKAHEQAEKRTRWLARQNRVTTQERLAKAGPGYREQVNAILAAVGLRQPEQGERGALRAFIDQLQEAGDETAVADAVIALVDGGKPTELRDLTVADFRAVYDAVRNLAHLAGQRNRLVAAADKIAFDEAVTAMVERAAEVNPDRLPEELSRRDLSLTDRAVDRVRRFASELDRPENIIEALDGGEAGPWHAYFWQGLNRAEDTAIGLRRRVGAQLKALRESMPDDFMASLDARVDLPFGANVSRGTLIGMVLNTGNAGNLQRLRDGGIFVNGAPVRLTDAQVAELRELLTADELRYVQGLWDAVNSLWPDITALQKAMSGIAPEKVEAQAFEVGGVTYRGGYWPLAYDHSKSNVGERQADDDALRVMMGAGYTRATTPKGYQKQRVEELSAPLQLDFGAVMAKHLDNVMTDIAYRAAVKDTVRILRSTRVKDAIISRLGKGAYDTLKGSVAYAVASNELAGQAATTARRMVSGIVSNSAVSALAIRPDIALGNYASAMMQALDRVGTRSLMRGWWAMHTPGRAELTGEITALSPFMAGRLADIDHFYRLELDKAQGRTGFGDAYRRVMMTLHRWADHDVTRAAWWGRYQEALAAGENREEAARLADKMIRQTQTANARKDVSAIERDAAFRESRMFMGPMFVILGRLRAAGKGEGATRTVGLRAASLLRQMFLAPALFVLAAGRWPEDGGDDDDDIGAGEWALWLATNTLLFPLQAVPILREIAGSVEAWATDRPINPRAAPTTQAAAGLVKASKSIADNIDDYQDTGELDWLEMTRDLTSAVGPFTGLPAGQTRITTRTIEAIADDPDVNAMEMTRMAVYGPPKH